MKFGSTDTLRKRTKEIILEIYQQDGQLNASTRQRAYLALISEYEGDIDLVNRLLNDGMQEIIDEYL